MTEEYAVLEIRIRKKEAKGYPVEFTLTRPGEAKIPFPIDHLSPEILDWKHGEDLHKSGKELFDLFIADKLRENWIKSFSSPQQKCRIQLWFDKDDEDKSIAPLHLIPWELLRDTTVKPSRSLVNNRNTPFSRFVVSEASGKTIEERPLKILVAVAAPTGLPSELNDVDVTTEEGIITRALSNLTTGQVLLTFIEQPLTLEKLEEHLQEDHYHILHLVGHGKFVAGFGAYLLLAREEDNQVKPVKDEDFAEMINRQGEYIPNFIYLSSCQTAKRAENDPFRGFAPALVQAGVPAVLAMQENIHIPTAQAFTETFYKELFQHGQIDLACNAARSQVLSKGLLGSYIPVLFSRLNNNQFLDPTDDAVMARKDYEPEVVYIRGGTFIMGSKPGTGFPHEETDHREIPLPPFYIGKYPITNEDYQKYLQKTKPKQLINPKAGWEDGKPPQGKLNHPLAGITWNEAKAYCVWLSKKTKRNYGLLSEAQWERAARGTAGRVYPWGETWEEGRCNHGSDQTTAVDKYPAQNEQGVYDMVGNVREWVNTRWGSREAEPDDGYRYPWSNDSREDDSEDNYTYRVHRGGAATDEQSQLRCSARGGFNPAKPGPPDKRHGFRVAINL